MMKTSNQRPSTSAVPFDNNIHQLTLTLIFMQLLKFNKNSKTMSNEYDNKNWVRILMT